MKKISRLKIAISAGAVGLLICAAPGTGFAKGGGHGGGGHGGGGHGGGGHGGGGHGGGMHFSASRGGGGRAAVAHFHAASHVSHFSASHANRSSHFSASHATRSSHFSASHATHFARPSAHTSTSRASHFTPSTSHALTTTARPAALGARSASLAHGAHFAGPRAFAAHRQFASSAAFRPFLGRGWHPYHHLGWVGPLFWPYAYGDFFYYALWPTDYAYADPFWAYGYGDIYEGIFSPYTYDQYVQGPGAPARMATLTQGMSQSCTEEAAEVTGWPIDQIQNAVQPNQQQNALLDDLANAVVKASDEIKSNCPTSVSFTPTARLSEMQQRLQGMVEAVNVVSPPLTKFYDSLTDEQKARFNDIAPPTPARGRPSQGQPVANTSAPQAQCGANVMAWPTDQIDRVVQPNDSQRAKLTALQSAAAQAADAIKAACPNDIPSTPPGRLDAVGKRLQTMLNAVKTVEPALADFYNSLSDDQKARFNTMGKQLFADNR